MTNRREFIKNTAFTATGMMAFGNMLAGMPLLQKQSGARKNRSRNILLRSGWQIENIGDIAHTPAMLALIERHVPDAAVTFWPWYHIHLEDEIRMLKRRFPKMKMVEGKLDAQG
ncbi:MAG TPA: hypothetical protein VM871_03865, partial [Flavisolibacter sp.]|nr:hypothetical protein [Flavisolibacter sp.]